ncbi:hypothetical protein D4Q85_00335 [bacterium]|nr:MAG: hypothetical protein D4Q85_00335 [bacterium]
MGLQLHYGTGLASMKTPAAVTADTYGTIIDLQDYTGEGLIMLNSGAGTADSGVTPSLATTLYSCATTGGTYAVVSTSVAFTAVTTAASAQKVPVDLNACSRYAKLLCDVTGSGASFTVSAQFLGNERGY